MSTALDSYFNHGWVSRRQYDAGKQFAGDGRVEVSRLRHRSMNHKPKGNRSCFEMAAIAAGRAHKAQRHLGHLRGIVVHVCCLDLPAKSWAQEHGKRVEDAMGILRFALDHLAGF
jgi:hypothetical protein